MSVSPDLSLGKVLADITSAGYTSAGGNRFTKGQCTWWAWGRAFEKKGRKLNVTAPANGNAWYSNIVTDSNVTKYPASKGPIVDSIASFSHGTCGHVVYVEAIRGKYTYFTEYNWNQSLNGVLQKVLTSEFANLHDCCTLLGSITVR